MTKKLEELLNINPTSEFSEVTPEVIDEISQLQTPPVNLQEQLEEFDKISSALPKVKGLGDLSDKEFDDLATKAVDSYSQLMDLGLNVEAKYSTRIFEVASSMLTVAVNAKNSKITAKLKMIELQIKKYKIDQKDKSDEGQVEGDGYIITDRASLLKKLKDMDK